MEISRYISEIRIIYLKILFFLNLIEENSKVECNYRILKFIIKEFAIIILYMIIKLNKNNRKL